MKTEEVLVSKLQVGDRVLFNNNVLRVDDVYPGYFCRHLKMTSLSNPSDGGHVEWKAESVIHRVLDSTSVVGETPASQPRFSVASDLDGSETLVMEHLDGWPPRVYAKTAHRGGAREIVAALNAMEK